MWELASVELNLYWTRNTSLIWCGVYFCAPRICLLTSWELIKENWICQVYNYILHLQESSLGDRSQTVSLSSCIYSSTSTKKRIVCFYSEDVCEDRHPLGGQRNQEAKHQSSRACWRLRVVSVENLTSASQAMSHGSNGQNLRFYPY